MKIKSNKDLEFKKDMLPGAVFVFEKEELIGALMWNYPEKKWEFQEGEDVDESQATK